MSVTSELGALGERAEALPAAPSAEEVVRKAMGTPKEGPQKPYSLWDSPTFKAQSRMAAMGIGSGAAAGALVDSEDRGRGALTGAAFGGALHAPYAVSKVLDKGAPAGVISDIFHEQLLKHPKLMLTPPAVIGGTLGGGSTALVDYGRLRSRRNAEQERAEKTASHHATVLRNLRRGLSY